MIELTSGVGEKFQITADSVVRIRRTVSGEAENCKTRIDWVTLKFAQEEPAAVAALVIAESPLARLATPEGSLLWFAGRQSAGPVWFNPDMAPAGTKSAFVLATKTQYVSNTPEEVQQVIRDNGGRPLPIPGSFMAAVRSVIDTVTGQSRGSTEGWE